MSEIEKLAEGAFPLKDTAYQTRSAPWRSPRSAAEAALGIALDVAEAIPGPGAAVHAIREGANLIDSDDKPEGLRLRAEPRDYERIPWAQQHHFQPLPPAFQPQPLGFQIGPGPAIWFGCTHCAEVRISKVPGG